MSNPRPLRVATRGSALALWQTNHVASLLGVEIETVIVRTEGDRTQKANVPIEKIAGRGVFVKEVQAAVLEGRADFAVHSAKDLPSITDEGLCLAAVLERGDPRDCLVGSALEDIPEGGLIGTGSVRRRAQMAWLRPDLRFSNLRGNVPTRLEKAKDFDAIVLAYAGLERLGLHTQHRLYPLDPSVMLPQVGQGALAVECRDSDERTITALKKLEHTFTRRAVDAERAFLAQLGGGCDLPVGAYATVSKGEVHLEALLASPDGKVLLRRQGSAVEGTRLGVELAMQLLNEDGGSRLLDDRRAATQ